MISSRGRAGTPEVFPFRSMRMPDVTTPLRTSSWGAALAAAAASMAWILYRHPLSLSLTFAAGVGLLAVLMLALVRFDAAVGLGVLLLAVVRIEPAPTDAVFAVVIAVALLTNRFGLRRVPPIALGLLGAFLALNLFSFVEVIDVSRGLTFFAITLYLVVFAIWLTDYVRSSGRAQLIVRLYVLAAVVSALVASLALFVAFPGHNTFVFGGDRAQGLFKDPVVFGPFLIPAFLILIEEIVNPRLIGGRAAWKAAGVSILGLGVVFSYSRAAWLSLALGLTTVLVVLALRRGGGRRSLIVFSVGEAFYSPRVYEYAAAIAPPGQEASYGSLAYLPFLVGKLLVGTGGWLLAAFCPEHGPRHSGTLWLIFALAASIAPIGLVALRRYIRVPEAGREQAS